MMPVSQFAGSTLRATLVGPTGRTNRSCPCGPAGKRIGRHAQRQRLGRVLRDRSAARGRRSAALLAQVRRPAGRSADPAMRSTHRAARGTRREIRRGRGDHEQFVRAAGNAARRAGVEKKSHDNQSKVVRGAPQGSEGVNTCARNFCRPVWPKQTKNEEGKRSHNWSN